MNENRKSILEMLAAGKITAEEAERLIAALEKESRSGGAQNGDPAGKPKPKYLRVIVEAAEHHSGEGPTKVNVRVPMQLLRAGVRLTSLIPAQARVHINEAMREHGVNIDVGQLKPENLEELIDHLNDLTVDVNEKDAQVRVFCE
jgi:polyhydroxyalkanoate synthesis regulator phasin